MSTVSRPPEVPVAPPSTTVGAGQAAPRVTRIDLMVLGLLVAAVGIGWLLTGLGIDVSWRLAAPAALVAVGLVLVVTVVARRDGGRNAGRSGLAWLGAALLMVSLAIGVDAPRYAAPMGNVGPCPRGC